MTDSPWQLQVFTSEVCLDHRPPPGFPERVERLTSVLEALGEVWEIERVPLTPERERALLGTVSGVHAESYLERFRNAVNAGEPLLDTTDNPLSEGTWRAAWGACAACLSGLEWVMGAPRRQAMVAVRPPGHHAERSMAMGFCYLNTVAIAADQLKKRGLSRVAIVDFDVHHGNGTQHLFEADGEVYYISLHQSPFYPGTGAATETGRGAGLGATLNLPLPAGTGDDVYGQAFKERVLPALAAFRPQMLLLSAGFDAWQRDPVGGMRVTESAFRAWGRELAQIAALYCEGRLLAVLEGGYDIAELGRLAVAHCRGWEDARSVAPSS